MSSTYAVSVMPVTESSNDELDLFGIRGPDFIVCIFQAARRAERLPCGLSQGDVARSFAKLREYSVNNLDFERLADVVKGLVRGADVYISVQTAIYIRSNVNDIVWVSLQKNIDEQGREKLARLVGSA